MVRGFQQPIALLGQQVLACAFSQSMAFCLNRKASSRGFLIAIWFAPLPSPDTGSGNGQLRDSRNVQFRDAVDLGKAAEIRARRPMELLRDLI